jgi:hypothetical protein
MPFVNPLSFILVEGGPWQTWPEKFHDKINRLISRVIFSQKHEF